MFYFWSHDFDQPLSNCTFNIAFGSQWLLQQVLFCCIEVMHCLFLKCISVYCTLKWTLSDLMHSFRHIWLVKSHVTRNIKELYQRSFLNVWCRPDCYQAYSLCKMTPHWLNCYFGNITVQERYERGTSLCCPGNMLWMLLYLLTK